MLSSESPPILRGEKAKSLSKMLYTLHTIWRHLKYPRDVLDPRNLIEMGGTGSTEIDHPESYNSPSASCNLQDKGKNVKELLGTTRLLKPQAAHKIFLGRGVVNKKQKRVHRGDIHFLCPHRRGR